MATQWWDVTLRAITEAGSLAELDCILHLAVGEIGGNSHAFFSGVLAHDVRQQPGTIFQSEPVALHRYPENWARRYREQGYYKDDPVVWNGLKSVLPFRWSDLERAAKGRSRQIFAEAREMGLRTGVSASVHGHDGTFSILNVAFAEEGPHTDAVISANSHAIHLLVSHLHATIARLAPTVDQRADGLTLTPREQEVLRWMANGKTYSQIAHLLGISGRTVREHLDRAANKLGVDSKSQLLAEAVARGMTVS